MVKHQDVADRRLSECAVDRRLGVDALGNCSYDDVRPVSPADEAYGSGGDEPLLSSDVWSEPLPLCRLFDIREQ